jgi:hypothetical protein
MARVIQQRVFVPATVDGKETYAIRHAAFAIVHAQNVTIATESVMSQ